MRKVFGVGLPRTGTQSLTMVAKMLGLKTSHPRQGGYMPDEEVDFMADTPAWADWKELAEKYPNAGFILTIRDITLWESSFWNVLGTFTRYTLKNPPREHDEIDYMNYLAYKKVFKSPRFITQDNLPNIFREHNTAVMDYMKANNRDLLVLDVSKETALLQFTKWMDMELVNFPRVR